ncbi:uncharacterized protein METZ01_LOCUS167403, partial [marine metagenome]
SKELNGLCNDFATANYLGTFLL